MSKASVRWDPDEVEFIESNQGMTVAAIAVALGRTKEAVASKRRKLRRARQGKQTRPKNQTLCWECQLSCGRRQCVWAAFGIPVPGWKATPTELRATEHSTPSYCVHECPRFEPDQRRRTG